MHCLRYLFDELTEEAILKIDRANEIANCSVTSFRKTRSESRGEQLTLDLFNFVEHLKEAGEKITRRPDVPVAPK